MAAMKSQSGIRLFPDPLAAFSSSDEAAGALDYVKSPQELPKDVPTDQEVRRMLLSIDTARATGFRDRAILEVLYSTGIRRQELIDLKVGDVDLERGYLRVERGKGGKGRVDPLGRVAGDWVRRYLLAIRPELIRAGAHPWHVKEILGHEDLRSLDAYAKLTILDLTEAHRRHHPRKRDEGRHGSDRRRGSNRNGLPGIMTKAMKKKTKPEPCDFCDGVLEPRTVTVNWRQRGQLVVIEGVPALVCNRCGERYSSSLVMRRMTEIAKSRASAKHTIRVPVTRFDVVA